MSESRNRIVAAVADDDATAMLTFAAEEAMRAGSDLHLVHVMAVPPGPPEFYDRSIQSAWKHGDLILDRAARTARQLVAGKLAVTSELVEDRHGVVDDIVARSDGARLVVLQHRHLSGVRRLTSGSTTGGVAARANAPVVSVPESWRPSQDPYHRLTVGVRDPSSADETLRTAFERAAERGDRLRVVHAWWLAAGYDAVMVDNDLLADSDRRFRAELAPHLDTLQSRYPDVAVEVQVRHAPTDVALLEATEDADLLVLGRRHPRLPIGSHLGPTVRLALRSSPVPVMVVEVAPHPASASPSETEDMPVHH